uniref:Uncharacterized protein n=1 Tax=Biomphalaria glabrata TaxID=6526 RepID=A0A2C9KLU4_BIOGL
VLNEMNVTRADIPCHGLMSLCPNIVDLDLANNLLDKWTELLAILSNLPKVKYVNVSRNSLRLNPVLNEMNVTRADIPCHGLMSLCPNIVDLDLANNLLDKWTELLAILSNLPKVKYVNVSRNSLRLNPDDPLPESNLSVENLALNDTGVSLDEIAKLSSIMPMLKELHLCGNSKLVTLISFF